MELEIIKFISQLKIKCPTCGQKIESHNIELNRIFRQRAIFFAFCANNHRPIKSIMVVESNEVQNWQKISSPLTRKEIQLFKLKLEKFSKKLDGNNFTIS